MVEHIGEDEVDRAVRRLELEYPEFSSLWGLKECCFDHLIDYQTWDWRKIRDWERYCLYKWMRGDEDD